MLLYSSFSHSFLEKLVPSAKLMNEDVLWMHTDKILGLSAATYLEEFPQASSDFLKRNP
jgi:hypothetical protein